MVEDNRWEFQTSVWDAAQQQLQHHQHHQHQQYSEENDEGGSETRLVSQLPDRGDSGKTMHQFQKTDLPHPGWKQIVSSMIT